MAGIKETKDCVIAIAKFIKIVKPHLADGAQLKDIIAVYNIIDSDPVMQQAFMDMVTNIAAVPGELNDINVFEFFELLRAFKTA